MKKAKDQPESEPAELASLVGERIRKIRKEEGLSLELFALRCDMNAAYVGHIERGVQNPTLNTLERICKGLDISVEDLFIDKSTTVDMNTAVLQYFSQITCDLSPEQFHRLLNIIKEIVAVMRWPSLLRHLRIEIWTSLHEILIKSEGVFFGIPKSQFLTPLFISSASLYISGVAMSK